MGSPTRMNMLQLLAENETHISGLVKELNISVPVAAKHVKILEDSDLIERKEFGRTHVMIPPFIHSSNFPLRYCLQLPAYRLNNMLISGSGTITFWPKSMAVLQM